MKTVDLSNLHFCKESKVRYRVHLTAGMVATTLLSMVGMAYGVDWLSHSSAAANLFTAVWWIWE